MYIRPIANFLVLKQTLERELQRIAGIDLKIPSLAKYEIRLQFYNALM